MRTQIHPVADRVCTIVIKQSACKQLSWRCFFRFSTNRIFFFFCSCLLVRLSSVALCKIVRGSLYVHLMLASSVAVAFFLAYNYESTVLRVSARCCNDDLHLMAHNFLNKCFWCNALLTTRTHVFWLFKTKCNISFPYRIINYDFFSAAIHTVIHETGHIFVHFSFVDIPILSGLLYSAITCPQTVCFWQLLSNFVLLNSMPHYLRNKNFTNR